MSSPGASTFSPVMTPPGPALSAPGQTVGAAPPPTNGFAITSMVLGIVTYPLFFVGVITALLSLIFGIVGVNQIRQKGQRGMGMAVTGLVLSGIYLILAVTVFGAFWAFVF